MEVTNEKYVYLGYMEGGGGEMLCYVHFRMCACLCFSNGGYEK